MSELGRLVGMILEQGGAGGECARAAAFAVGRSQLARASEVAREHGVSVETLERRCRREGVRWVRRPARLGCLCDRDGARRAMQGKGAADGGCQA